MYERTQWEVTPRADSIQMDEIALPHLTEMEPISNPRAACSSTGRHACGEQIAAYRKVEISATGKTSVYPELISGPKSKFCQLV